ncbi:hypothetical protein HMPREF1321_1049 [Capnocytophaga sp. oral taxon 412 str. F0487]|jgi:hypothetical protein|uniref:Uncharacterized protein n=1 Tax=Capnocytophaga ochracea TaxID=1018 RepID=A0AA47A215_CAPOC|nr:MULTISPECIES: hypothetical protein [Capnocytophaga]EIW93642.1 hypothetical protein HMPREF1321_1049 [Capnocytophaga sp. oral taxon 412 str. F0487]UZD40181.1 hypothetical protein OL231_08310 [Capnocytophaga ochracea]DAI34763.1 MAG TPA: hypothetical protein [Bacteriophage sp.]
MTAIETLKQWFSNLKKPTQEQFWAWLDSFWHKSEKIPMASVEGLDKLVEGTASAEQLSNHLNDTQAHKILFDEVKKQIQDINTILQVDDVSLDTLQEIVTELKNHRQLSDLIGTKIDKEIFGLALEVTDNTILSKEHAGRVLRCNNDTDINLDFSTFPDNALLSVVKAGSASIIFTGKTLVGDSSITGAKGSTASLVVCGTEVISNVNNK